MNYRHAYHAGNFADVLKHAALALMIERLKVKDKPFAVIETHAGRGLYDLSGPEAQKTGEWREGIGRLLAAPAPEALAPLLSAVRRRNPSGMLKLYPGSPLIALALMRAIDRYTGGELHPFEAQELKAAVGGDRRARLVAADGYATLASLVPPAEKRGLVLIDPPFEKPDEFVTLAQALAGAWAKWPGGSYAVWYPVKDASAVRAFHDELKAQGLKDMIEARLGVGVAPGAEAKGMRETGLLVVNPPFTLEEQLRGLVPWLGEALAQGPGAKGTVTRIAAE